MFQTFVNKNQNSFQRDLLPSTRTNFNEEKRNIKQISSPRSETSTELPGTCSKSKLLKKIVRLKQAVGKKCPRIPIDISTELYNFSLREMFETFVSETENCPLKFLGEYSSELQRRETEYRTNFLVKKRNINGSSRYLRNYSRNRPVGTGCSCGKPDAAPTKRSFISHAARRERPRIK